LLCAGKIIESNAALDYFNQHKWAIT